MPPGGSIVAREELVLEVAAALVILKRKRSYPVFVLKFVPVTVTGVPGDPIVGLNPVTVGTADVVTVKLAVLVALPKGEVTVIGPVTAPFGTIASISVAVADVTTAELPLN
jgi:hypothetical protein